MGHMDSQFTPVVRSVPQHVNIALKIMSGHNVMDVEKQGSLAERLEGLHH